MTYIVGSHWFICDVCGQKYRSTEKKKRWDGLIVCPADNEADHPQKYIRVESDGQAVPDPRPRPEDVFALPVYCTPVTRTSAADDGTADCMTVDYRLNINYADYGGYQPIAVAPTLLLYDTFTDTDSLILSSHVPNTAPSGWEWGNNYGTPQIQSNQLISANASDPYYSSSEMPLSASSVTAEFPLLLRVVGKADGANAKKLYGNGLTITTDAGLISLTMYFTIVDGGELRASAYTPSVTLESSALDSTVPHTLELFVEETQMTLFVDGEAVASAAVSMSPVISSATVLVVGGSSYLDEISVTSSAVSPS